MRSALRDFKFLLKKKPLKKSKKELKNIADALGAARDADVTIVALEKLLKKAKPEKIKNGIENLIAESREKRARAQLELQETLAATAIEDLQDDFSQAIAAATKPNKHHAAVSFNRAGREAVERSLANFLDLSAGIYAPFDDDALHEMRIAAKRLRYAIELFAACWGERIAPFAGEIAAMQSSLGEVHDADVWIEGLTERLQNKKTDRNQAADIWLLGEFVKHRAKNYQSALARWNRWRNEDFTGKMRRAVTTVN